MVRLRRWAKSWYKGLSGGEEFPENDEERAKKLKEIEDRYYIAMAKVYGTI